MREIKFRAWDRDGKRMIAVDQISIAAQTLWGLRHPGGKQFVFTWLQVDILQFTGLKDKNGKEIYEGDILLADVCEDGELERLEVEFRMGAFKLGYYDNGLRHPQKFEVIGNIYENPKLLK